MSPIIVRPALRYVRPRLKDGLSALYLLIKSSFKSLFIFTAIALKLSFFPRLTASTRGNRSLRIFRAAIRPNKSSTIAVSIRSNAIVILIYSSISVARAGVIALLIYRSRSSSSRDIRSRSVPYRDI